MIIKFLFSLLVSIFTGANSSLPVFSVDNPNTPGVNENHSTSKLANIVVKKDSVSQTQIPIIIFNLINTNHQNGNKNSGSLKNAGKIARTANSYIFPGKI